MAAAGVVWATGAALAAEPHVSTAPEVPAEPWVTYDFGHGWRYRLAPSTQQLLTQYEFLLKRLEDRGIPTIDGRFERFLAMDLDGEIDAAGFREITREEASRALRAEEERFRQQLTHATGGSRPAPRATASRPPRGASPNYQLYAGGGPGSASTASRPEAPAPPQTVPPADGRRRTIHSARVRVEPAEQPGTDAVAAARAARRAMLAEPPTPDSSLPPIGVTTEEDTAPTDDLWVGASHGRPARAGAPVMPPSVDAADHPRVAARSQPAQPHVPATRTSDLAQPRQMMDADGVIPVPRAGERSLASVDVPVVDLEPPLPGADAEAEPEPPAPSRPEAARKPADFGDRSDVQADAHALGLPPVLHARRAATQDPTAEEHIAASARRSAAARAPHPMELARVVAPEPRPRADDTVAGGSAQAQDPPRAERGRRAVVAPDFSAAPKVAGNRAVAPPSQTLTSSAAAAGKPRRGLVPRELDTTPPPAWRTKHTDREVIAPDWSHVPGGPSPLVRD